MEAYRLTKMNSLVSYIESHLREPLDLDAVAGAAGYSKYHLHRTFTELAGMTPHTYIRRRRLTEAARLLVFSERPVAEIALEAGYESQQAFAAVFKVLYKRTPVAYRREGFFYPLQLELAWRGPLSPPDHVGEIAYAAPEDLPAWMDFAAQVIQGFPRLEEASHRQEIRRRIRQRQALLLRDGPAIIGAAAFSRRTGHIDFLAVHPQYRRCNAGGMLLDYLRQRLLPGRAISITTFRQGDRADTGQRAEYLGLGFTGAELLTEFGYPTQRLVLPPETGRERHG